MKIKLNNYKIRLYDCKNKHNTNKIKINEFDNAQYIDQYKIVCNKCKERNKKDSYNNEFYICNSCKINLCPLCKNIHDKKHNIINYDQKNYICETHNMPYISYCKECQNNKCMICEQDH